MFVFMSLSVAGGSADTRDNDGIRASCQREETRRCAPGKTRGMTRTYINGFGVTFTPGKPAIEATKELPAKKAEPASLVVERGATPETIAAAEKRFGMKATVEKGAPEPEPVDAPPEV